ncbi:DnaJ domain-containing protein, partial [Delphinella strobiligena]
FYDLLSIAPSVSKVDIQKAYKAAALKYHPDKDLHNPEATKTFQELQRVYDVLMDPEKRKVYDQETLR